MSDTAQPAVTVEKAGDHIALVTINRPEARNAVNGAVAQGLEKAVRDTEADDDIWVVILTGAGEQAFCAGADLKEVSAGRRPDGAGGPRVVAGRDRRLQGAQAGGVPRRPAA